MDVRPELARTVAERVGARSSDHITAVLEDRSVDVVAICSPSQFHAEQVELVAAAGKKAVLCEKPLATGVAEATRLARAANDAEMPVLVGTMHAYDPSWLAAKAAWSPLTSDAHFIRSTLYLPPNQEFIGLATDAESNGPGRRPSQPEEAPASTIRDGLLRLATHAIPQVRQFLCGPVALLEARAVAPLGYRIVCGDDGRLLVLVAVMGGEWPPRWTLEVVAEGGVMSVDYPPSYVHAESATVRIRTVSGVREWHAESNGYENEWRHLAEVAVGACPPEVPLETAVDDLRFALDLADACEALAVTDAEASIGVRGERS